MDAIKITRGRTRRSQGAGDALGGPGPAAAGGGKGRAGRLRGRRSRISRRSRCSCRPRGSRRGAPARRGRSPSAALGKRSWCGRAPIPAGGDGGSGKGEGEASWQGCRAPISPSPRRPHGTVRSSGREPQSNIKGAAGCAPGQPPVPPSRERHRRSAVQIQPTDLLLHDRPHKLLLECPSPHAGCEIYPSLCLDRFL